MGTLVTMEVVHNVARPGETTDKSAIEKAIERAFGWFHEIEERCTRFDERSELMQLSAHIGEAVPASPILYEAVAFASRLAEETNGAFDPTVGNRMAQRGFNREHRTGKIVRAANVSDESVTWRDIRLNPKQKTITLLRPMTLDLGAVAKGLAVDTAARELQPFQNFAINAGGDLYLGGLNTKGAPWSVGIRHPRRNEEMIDSLLVSDQAICTSGDYERPSPFVEKEHHIIDPRTGKSPRAIASVTVIAHGAMLADALATAAFVLGADEGIQLLNRMGVEGLIVTADLERRETGGLRRAA